MVRPSLLFFFGLAAAFGFSSVAAPPSVRLLRFSVLMLPQPLTTSTAATGVVFRPELERALTSACRCKTNCVRRAF